MESVVALFTQLKRLFEKFVLQGFRIVSVGLTQETQLSGVSLGLLGFSTQPTIVGGGKPIFAAMPTLHMGCFQG